VDLIKMLTESREGRGHYAFAQARDGHMVHVAHVLDAARRALSLTEGAAAPTVKFLGVDPLDPVRGAALPMIPDSWRFGFTQTDSGLMFGLRDDGPFVAYEAIRAAQPAPEGADPMACIECGGRTQWRCPACNIRSTNWTPEGASLTDEQRDEIEGALTIADALAEYCRRVPRSYLMQQAEDCIRAMHAALAIQGAGKP
jgi:hypothetical protein